MNTNKYTEEHSIPKYNAQRNLAGRSHFVDDDTLRYFGARILNANAVANGRLFVIIHSVRYERNAREYNFCIFNLAGQVIGDSKNYFKTAIAARKCCEVELATIDARQATIDAIAHIEAVHKRDTKYINTHWDTTPDLSEGGE